MPQNSKDIEKLIGNLLGADPSNSYSNEPLSQGQNNAVDAKLAPVLNFMNRSIDLCKKDNHPIENILCHEHLLSSSDGNGAFIIISLFKVSPGCTPPGTPQLSAITTSIIRCHDNLRESFLIPSQAETSKKYFSDFVSMQRRDTGCDFRPVSYNVCKKLMKECLLRMTKSKKVLIGKDQRTIARLYDLNTSKPEEKLVPKMPDPSPAPSVEALWLTLNRPEYYQWGMPEDLRNYLRQSAGTSCITRKILKRALRHIAKDKYRRERMYAMIELHSLWHMLEDESEVTSWLLWELQSMKNFDEGDKEGAIVAMEKNIIFQLMINKFFDDGCEDRRIPHYPSEGEFGYGMTNYYFYQVDLNERGTLPPNYVYDASVARGKKEAASAAVRIADDLEHLNISEISKVLRRKRNGCAICGTTRFKGGGNLKECVKCKSVVYCSREHQKLHWKNGHKQECTPADIVP